MNLSPLQTFHAKRQVKVQKVKKSRYTHKILTEKEYHFFSLNHNLHIHMIISRAPEFLPLSPCANEKNKKHLLRPSLFYSLESQYKFNPSPSLPI